MKPMKNLTTALLVVVAVALQACASLNPVSHAKTTEQRAYALYGEFVVIEEQAAVAAQSADVPSAVRQSIVAADVVAKPIADELLKTAVLVKSIREDFAQGQSSEEKVVIATASLQKWYAALAEQLPKLADALRGARP